MKNWKISICVEAEEKARIAYQVALTGKSLGTFVKELILDAIRKKEGEQVHEITHFTGTVDSGPRLIKGNK